jgi:hypothetical protein
MYQRKNQIKKLRMGKYKGKIKSISIIGITVISLSFTQYLQQLQIQTKIVIFLKLLIQHSTKTHPSKFKDL